MRALLLAHRYLGIGVGALMVTWCLSGVVMLFVPFPRLTERQRLAALPAIAWNGCCALEGDAARPEETTAGFNIEMLAGRLVLRAQAGGGSIRLLDLVTATVIPRVSPEQATEVARAFASRAEGASPRLLGLVDRDQWTLSGVPGAERPLYRFALGDRAATELYVSSKSGRAVQVTTARERFWSWLGSIPHWLYVARLRRHLALWNAVVVYAALAGCFLTATGLVMGLRQLRPKFGQGWSPYRGFKRWHHVAGLVFGLMTLTWVTSGMLSMNPWGLLEGGDARPERARLAGPALPPSRLKMAMRALAQSHSPSKTVSVTFAPLGGGATFVTEAEDGSRRRFDEAGRAAPLTTAELSRITAALNGAGPAELIPREDAYFYSQRDEPVRLPVFRVIAADAEETRYYVDAVSGDIEAKVDRNGKRYRWLHSGLHRIDFAPVLRGGRIGYAAVLLLMSGVLIVCVTGAYLGWRRLARRATG